MAGWDYGKTPNVWRPAEVQVPGSGADLGLGAQPVFGEVYTETITEYGYPPLGAGATFTPNTAWTLDLEDLTQNTVTVQEAITNRALTPHRWIVAVFFTIGAGSSTALSFQPFGSDSFDPGPAMSSGGTGGTAAKGIYVVKVEPVGVGGVAQVLHYQGSWLRMRIAGGGGSAIEQTVDDILRSTGATEGDNDWDVHNILSATSTVTFQINATRTTGNGVCTIVGIHYYKYDIGLETAA